MPRILSAPNAAPRPEETAGPEFAELAESAGLILDRWQRLVLDVALAEDPETGLWAAFEAVVIVPRQNGKGSVIEALELGWLFLLGEKVLHTAQLGQTAHDGYERLLGLINDAPHLKRRLGKVRHSADEVSISTVDGGLVKFSPRSPRLGRGQQYDKLVIDEAMFLEPDDVAAQMPTMSTRDNPQAWYFSSAGRASSTHLRALRDRGRSGDDGLAYLEWSVEPPSDGALLDLQGAAFWAAVAQSNPSVGSPRLKAISPEFIRAEQQAMSVTPGLFDREVFGIFDEPQSAGRVITAAMWDPLADPGSVIVGEPVFAVAVTPERDAAAIVVVGRRADGIPQAEAAAVGAADPDDGDDATAGLGWVIEWFEKRPGSTVAVAANGPAGGLIAKLAAAGVEVVKLSDAEMARGVQGLFDTVAGGGMRHLGDPLMDAAVGAGRKREIGDGAWTWSRKSSAANITLLEAMTAAMHVVDAAGDPMDNIW